MIEYLLGALVGSSYDHRKKKQERVCVWWSVISLFSSVCVWWSVIIVR